MDGRKIKDIENYREKACATKGTMPTSEYERPMQTPRHLYETRNFSLSPPAPPGGYEPRELAKCGFPEFIPSPHHENGQFPVHCILDKNLPAKLQKTIRPPKVELSELHNDLTLLQLPDLDEAPSLAQTKPTLHIRPRGGLPFSENKVSDPMELMKAFVKETYDHHKRENRTHKKAKKDADRPHELTEVILKKSMPNAARLAEVQNKLGEHLHIGRAIQLGATDRKKRQVRRSYAAMGA